jgi:hypothetical protein
MIADLGARRRIRDLVFEVIQIHETFAASADSVCCA